MCFRISLRDDDWDLTALTASRNLALDIHSYSARLTRTPVPFSGSLSHFPFPTTFPTHPAPSVASNSDLSPFSSVMPPYCYISHFLMTIWKGFQEKVGWSWGSTQRPSLRDHHSMLPIAPYLQAVITFTLSSYFIFARSRLELWINFWKLSVWAGVI